MATKTYSLQDALAAMYDQLNSNPQLAATIPGFKQGIGNYGRQEGMQAILNSAPDPATLFGKMGWQYDPSTQQVTTPWTDSGSPFSSDLFGEFLKVPAVFAGLAGGAGALSGALGSGAAGGGMTLGDPSLGALADTGAAGGGMTGSLETLASPNTFLGSSADAGGVPAVGNESAWWGDVPQGMGSEWNGAVTGAAGSAAGSVAGNAASTAGKTALSNILSGNGTSDDWLKVAGALAPSLLGAYASNQQTGALKDLASQFASYGAPYRQKLADLMSNPSSFLSSPEVQGPLGQGMTAAAHALSVKGNPFGSGNAWTELTNNATNTLYGQLQNKENQLAGFGGLTAYNAAAPQAATNAINSNANVYNAIGSGMANVFNPPQSLAQILGQLKGVI